MKIVVYKSNKNDDAVSGPIVDLIKERLIGAKIDICVGMDNLIGSLRRFLVQRPDMIILRASDEEELRIMAARRELFSDIFVILIIPEEKKEIVRLAHKLHPRLLIIENGAIAMLSEVIKKMQHKISNDMLLEVI